MAIKPRDELKTAFETSKIPTQSDFGDLIDSALNLAEINDISNPLGLMATGESIRVLDVFYSTGDPSPQMSMSFGPLVDPNNIGLGFGKPDKFPQLFLDPVGEAVNIGSRTYGDKQSQVLTVHDGGTHTKANVEINGDILLQNHGIGPNPRLIIDSNHGAGIEFDAETFSMKIAGPAGVSLWHKDLDGDTPTPALETQKIEGYDGDAPKYGVSVNNLWAKEGIELGSGSLIIKDPDSPGYDLNHIVFDDTVGGLRISAGLKMSFGFSDNGGDFIPIIKLTDPSFQDGDRDPAILFEKKTTFSAGATFAGNIELQAPALITQEPWQTVENFESQWASAVGEFNHAQYFKDSMGIVHLRGIVNADEGNTSSGSITRATIFTLPKPCWPEKRELLAVATADDNDPSSDAPALGRVDVIKTGEVFCFFASRRWLSLDGVTFMAKSQ
jgi:hypothetical protein